MSTLAGLDALAGVVDGSEATRKAIGEKYSGLPIFETVDQAVASASFGAVAIATPADTHYEVASTAYAAGLHVFVEKPVTLSSNDAYKLLEMTKHSDRVLMVGHLLLFQPAVQFVRKAIAEQLVGDLVSVHQERLGLGRARNTENALWSLGVHDVAVAQYWIDSRSTEVVASGVAALTKGVEDDVYLHTTFENGCASHLHCSWLWPERRRRSTIIGSTGMLIYDELEQKVTLHKKSIDSSLANVDEGEELVFEGASEPLKLEMQHFLDCCKTGATPTSHIQSAVEVVKILEKAGKSVLC